MEQNNERLMTKKEAEINNRYTYHKPTEEQAGKYVMLRGRFKELASMIENLCPESREKSLAHTNLQQTIMWANASIAINKMTGETND